jgi:hypothetical protein
VDYHVIYVEKWASLDKLKFLFLHNFDTINILFFCLFINFYMHEAQSNYFNLIDFVQISNIINQGLYLILYLIPEFEVSYFHTIHRFWYFTINGEVLFEMWRHRAWMCKHAWLWVWSFGRVLIWTIIGVCQIKL